MMKLDKVDNKSKRLRKKLYLGEFAVFGFQVQCSLACQTDTDYDQFSDELISWMEARDLSTVCGASHGRCDAFVMPEARYGSPTEQDRTELQSWLAQHPMVTEVHVGELVDLTYGEFGEEA